MTTNTDLGNALSDGLLVDDVPERPPELVPGLLPNGLVGGHLAVDAAVPVGAGGSGASIHRRSAERGGRQEVAGEPRHPPLRNLNALLQASGRHGRRKSELEQERDGGGAAASGGKLLSLPLLYIRIMPRHRQR